jgi:ribonuclease HI
VNDPVLYTDGASLGNPGPAGIGYVLFDGDDVLAEHSEDIGYGTNNQAEYRAVIAGLSEARERGIPRLVVRSDSELLVRQLTGAYKVRNHLLRPLKEEVAALAASFEEVRFEHVRREGNARADELAKSGAEAARARGVGPARGEPDR